MPLRVNYDSKQLIAAVGPSVWAKLGPEKWFKNYRVAVADKRGYDKDFVIDLGIKSTDMGEISTQKVINTEKFIEVAGNELADYKFVVYKPVQAPRVLSPDRFLANDPQYGVYEDKKHFRDTFSSQLPIPKYDILTTNEFLSNSAEDLYKTYQQKWGEWFVIQDNIASGGRGTYIIKSADDARRAMETQKTESIGSYVIISEFFEGTELSTQTFVSAEHIVRGPLQQQLVRNPELLNPDGRGGIFFCGGKFIYDASPKVVEQAESIVSKIAGELKRAGYKGIFGVDLLVGADESVVAIEINARTTGLLPLLNEQTVDIPMYLLHILELTGETYTVEGDQTIAPYHSLAGPQSFIIVFNTMGQSAYLDSTIKTGNYKLIDGGLELIDREARWNPEADCMIQLFSTDSFPARPNQKFCTVYLRDEGFDKNGTLTELGRYFAQYVKHHAIAA